MEKSNLVGLEEKRIPLDLCISFYWNSSPFFCVKKKGFLLKLMFCSFLKNFDILIKISNFDPLGRKDSNLRTSGPKPGALPLGHAPFLFYVNIVCKQTDFVKSGSVQATQKEIN